MNKVIHGDCLEVMPTIPGKSIDMILCDLPYGTTACKWDTIIPLEPLWKEYKRLIKDNGAIVLTASQPFTTVLINSNIAMFKYEWCWDKGNCTGYMMAKYQPMKQHENILVFGRGRVNYNPQMELLKKGDYRIRRTRNRTREGPEVYGGQKVRDEIVEYKDVRYPKSIIYFASNMKNVNRLHPTQKPVALFEYLIKTYTNEGETVLDNCAGSGTTAIACINTNRNYILIEKEQEYIGIINKRISEHEKQLAII